MKIKKVFDFSIIIIIPLVVIFIISLTKIWGSESDENLIKYVNYTILLAIILGDALRNYFKRMTNYIELIQNNLTISDSIHRISINIETIMNIGYDDHNLFFDCNGTKYTFKLYGYDRNKIDKLVEAIGLKE